MNVVAPGVVRELLSATKKRLGNHMSFWTKKHFNGLRKALKDKRPIEQVELDALAEFVRKDMAWKTKTR